MEPVTIIISGHPVPKGRPRMTKHGHAYTPERTRAYGTHGGMAAQLAMGDRPPIEGPVSIHILIELTIPASWSARKRDAAIVGSIRPTSRPDVDNFVKSICDSLNGIVVIDDSQIVDLHATKKYGVNPKLVATIFPIDASPSNRRAPT
jgi:Holliday junction resolvase RusA-like endonuclease